MQKTKVRVGEDNFENLSEISRILEDLWSLQKRNVVHSPGGGKDGTLRGGSPSIYLSSEGKSVRREKADGLRL